jgi:hypothetical protein
MFHIPGIAPQIKFIPEVTGILANQRSVLDLFGSGRESSVVKVGKRVDQVLILVEWHVVDSNDPI